MGQEGRGHCRGGRRVKQGSSSSLQAKGHLARAGELSQEPRWRAGAQHKGQLGAKARSRYIEP